jgi:hypothetical protein
VPAQKHLPEAHVVKTSRRAVSAFLLVFCLVSANLRAQLPTGGIAGAIRDQSEALVRGAVVTVKNADTGQARSATTDEAEEFVFAQLPPGVYELSVEAEGFQNPRKTVVVQTGSTTRADVQLSVDVLQQAVEAIAYLPELRYDWHGVDGVVSRFQIENLPLNGRT